jgi:hypothetical protein
VSRPQAAAAAPWQRQSPQSPTLCHPPSWHRPGPGPPHGLRTPQCTGSPGRRCAPPPLSTHARTRPTRMVSAWPTHDGYGVTPIRILALGSPLVPGDMHLPAPAATVGGGARPLARARTGEVPRSRPPAPRAGLAQRGAPARRREGRLRHRRPPQSRLRRRRAHSQPPRPPTAPERAVLGVLDGLWQREVRASFREYRVAPGVYADFAWPGRRLAVEVHGSAQDAPDGDVRGGRAGGADSDGARSRR